ncbi:MAG TPA: EpsI family protein [Gemmatimonadales bacterium]
MRSDWRQYLPAGVLAAGCLLVVVGANSQQALPLRAPLSQLPARYEGYDSRNEVITPEEQRVAGMSSYSLRTFTRDSATAFTVYVGYYERQVQGKTIHSPKNCLPGAGWEAVSSGEQVLATSLGPVLVNRYLLVNKQQRALVYYWYQGRGRVESNEYRVKLQLLRDSALRGRSDEALVRVVVPLRSADADAAAGELGARVSADLIPRVAEVLPS